MRPRLSNGVARNPKPRLASVPAQATLSCRGLSRLTRLLGSPVVFAPSIKGLYTSFGCPSRPQEPNHSEANQGKGYDGARNKSELTEGQP